MKTDFTNELLSLRSAEFQLALKSNFDSPTLTAIPPHSKSPPKIFHRRPNPVPVPTTTLASISAKQQNLISRASASVSESEIRALEDDENNQPSSPTFPSPTRATPPHLPNFTSPAKLSRALIGSSLDSQVEAWLAEVINKAGHSVVIPSNLRQAFASLEADSATSTHCNPTVPQNALRGVLLDRESLHLLGCPSALVTRLYRALYVYAVGFHQIISDLKYQCLDKNGGGINGVEIGSVIWQVYMYMLEEVESSDYKGLLVKMGKEHKVLIEEMVGRFEGEIGVERGRRMEGERNLGVLKNEIIACSKAKKTIAAASNEKDKVIEALRNELAIANSEVHGLTEELELSHEEIAYVKENLRLERENILRMTLSATDSSQRRMSLSSPKNSNSNSNGPYSPLSSPSSKKKSFLRKGSFKDIPLADTDTDSTSPSPRSRSFKKGLKEESRLSITIVPIPLIDTGTDSSSPSTSLSVSPIQNKRRVHSMNVLNESEKTNVKMKTKVPLIRNDSYQAINASSSYQLTAQTHTPLPPPFEGVGIDVGVKSDEDSKGDHIFRTETETCPGVPANSSNSNSMITLEQYSILEQSGKELKGEIDTLVITLSDLRIKNNDLEETVAAYEIDEEAFQEEIDSLSLQVDVLQASKNEVVRQFNSQVDEIKYLKDAADSEKVVRQNASQKLRALEFTLKESERNVEERDDLVKALKRDVLQKKVMQKEIQVKLDEQIELVLLTQQLHNKTISSHRHEREAIKATKKDLINTKNNANIAARKAATRFTAVEYMLDLQTEISVGLQTKYNRSSDDVTRLSNINDELEKSLQQYKIDLRIEQKEHASTFSDLTAEATGHDETKVNLRLRLEDIETHVLEHSKLKLEKLELTDKLDTQRQAFRHKENEVLMSSSITTKIQHQMEHANLSKVTAVKLKEVEIRKHKFCIEGLEEQLRVAALNAEEERARSNAMQEEGLKHLHERNLMLEAFKRVNDDGDTGVKLLDEWLHLTHEDGEGERLKIPKTHLSIFDDEGLGVFPSPFNFADSAKRKEINADDASDLKATQDATSSLNITEGVALVLNGSTIINQMMRRVHATHANAKQKHKDNLSNCVKLQACKQEYLEQVDHWRSVNITLSKDAREDSDGLKHQISAKNLLLVTARKLHEQVSSKLKVALKESKIARKKCASMKDEINQTSNMCGMAFEDARGNEMRFNELKRVAEISHAARHVMQDVFESVWHNCIIPFEPNTDTDTNTNTNTSLRTNFPVISTYSLWLSPTQQSLEDVLNGFSRVDDVWNHVQHVAAESTAQVGVLRQEIKLLQDQQQHLSEWAEKETMKRAQCVDFSAQFSCVNDPKQDSTQTDVTWLTRAPQVTDQSVMAVGENVTEKIVTVSSANYVPVVDDHQTSKLSIDVNTSKRGSEFNMKLPSPTATGRNGRVSGYSSSSPVGTGASFIGSFSEGASPAGVTRRIDNNSVGATSPTSAANHRSSNVSPNNRSSMSHSGRRITEAGGTSPVGGTSGRKAF